MGVTGMMAAAPNLSPVEGWVGDLARSLGFLADARFEAAPLLAQLFIAMLAALLAYFLIHSGQKRAAEENRKIERAKLLYELDREYHNLMARTCVVVSRRKLNGDLNVEISEMKNFEFALTKNVRWLPYPELDKAGDRIYPYINGCRYIRISATSYIDTLTLHAVIDWSKRVSSAISGGIVDPRDVANMWRHILPWSKDNRFSFMGTFFGVSSERVSPDDRSKTGARWHASFYRRRIFAMRSAAARVGYRFHQALDRLRPIRTEIPKEWSGDIAPLYLLIQTVIREAIRQGRIEILDFVKLAGGPDHVAESPIDQFVKDRLFHPVAAGSPA